VEGASVRRRIIRNVYPGLRGEDKVGLWTDVTALKRGDADLQMPGGLRRIINAHGGSIEIESGPGRGTLFVVVLPLQPANAGAAA
jgi:hypothetical protein